MSTADFVVVANRLPVDRNTDGAEGGEWRQSPGGLVTALEPVMRSTRGAWVGWPGKPDLEFEPFEFDGMKLVPVSLTADDVEDYYEGFSNDTIWPLYHDVIAEPRYRRNWWEAYQRVNRRFAVAAAEAAAKGGTVWVQDYQLQLVPRMLRDLRPDLTIGYFHHIPFPAYGLYSQLPWRKQVLEGLLGADVIGFQRVADAGNFARAVRRQLRFETKATGIRVPTGDGGHRTALAKAFPISIATDDYVELAQRPEIQARAAEIRASLGNPRKVLLGVDRLDYTKGIGHRLKAFGELLQDGRLTVEDVTLVQVASPSRERVDSYIQLRDEIELTVARINGDYDTIGHTAIRYLHQAFPREEMVALFLAADVMLVTALRDGMNLVAKEYVASRIDNKGVLVLSEFAGAADELASAIRINPHDIDGLKDAVVRAVELPAPEQGRRMRALRKRVREHNVEDWSRSFLESLSAARTASDAATGRRSGAPDELEIAVARAASAKHLLVALDFDGTLAPLVDEPMSARMLPAARDALARLTAAPGTTVALVSGRSLDHLAEISERQDDSRIHLAGSHGAEFWHPDSEAGIAEAEDDALRDRLTARAEELIDGVEGAWIEHKRFGFGLHTRLSEATEAAAAAARLDELVRREAPAWRRRTGQDILEFASRHEGKDSAVQALRERVGADVVLFAGDDVTDEDALAALGNGDVGIRVGAGESVAAYRVTDAAALAAVLERIANARAAR